MIKINIFDSESISHTTMKKSQIISFNEVLRQWTFINNDIFFVIISDLQSHTSTNTKLENNWQMNYWALSLYLSLK